jgi:protein-tyrosine phosphatase
VTDASPAERTLRLDGLVNARDLGGLRRVDGTRTPSGVFYRSENVDWLSPRGWDALAETGIRTIVDLRQPWERDRDVTSRPDWVSTVAVDLDGLDNQDFWKDYWDNGLVGTALYYAPHLRTMPDRSVDALTAIVSAPPGGVLFHCMGGRDRTGLIAMLLLTAADVVTDDIVDDYLETGRRGDLRASGTRRNVEEAELEALCRRHGSTTEAAFRSALAALDLSYVLEQGEMTAANRAALMSWRGALSVLPSS